MIGKRVESPLLHNTVNEDGNDTVLKWMIKEDSFWLDKELIRSFFL